MPSPLTSTLRHVFLMVENALKVGGKTLVSLFLKADYQDIIGRRGEGWAHLFDILPLFQCHFSVFLK